MSAVKTPTSVNIIARIHVALLFVHAIWDTSLPVMDLAA